MTVASHVNRDVEMRDQERADVRCKFAGLAVMALLPAVFWMIVMAVVGRYFGLNFSPTILASVGAGIGLFLTTVCAPLMTNA